MVYASPSYDQKAASSKQNMWQRFLDSLDWEKLTNKDGKDIRKVLGVLSSIPGIKVKTGKKGISE